MFEQAERRTMGLLGLPIPRTIGQMYGFKASQATPIFFGRHVIVYRRSDGVEYEEKVQHTRKRKHGAPRHIPTYH